MGYTQRFKNFIIDKSLRFFGHNPETSLRNNFVQIGTGEGKSVTLAVTAAVLSMLGFDVYCVCYSSYLSDRDYLSFKPLDEKLNLTEHIYYGMFNKICEDTINTNGDVRNIVKNLIHKGDNLTSISQNTSTNRANPRILLIDEVDVFFSKDFYGNSYNPMLNLTDPTINALIHHIWKERNTNLTLDNIRLLNVFEKCVKKFDKWQELIEEAVKEMLSSLKTFESHHYVVKDDKIGYINQDDINFNTTLLKIISDLDAVYKLLLRDAFCPQL